MAELEFDQNYPGGVAAQALDAFTCENRNDIGFAQWGKIILNWGTIDAVTKSPVIFLRPYTDATPAVSALYINTPGPQISCSNLTKTGFDVDGTGKVSWLAIGS